MGLVVIHALIFGVAPSPPPAPLFVSTGSSGHHVIEKNVRQCDVRRACEIDRKNSDRARTNIKGGSDKKRRANSLEVNQRGLTITGALSKVTALEILPTRFPTALEQF